MELTVKLGDPKKDNTIASEIGEFGVHSFTDRNFFDRKDSIGAEMDRHLSEKYLDALKLSPLKRELMREVKGRLKYMWGNVPEGKAIERPYFARKMQAARRIVLRAYEVVRAGASDEDTELVVNDMLSKADTLVGFTFDSLTNAINKSFTLQQAMPSQGGQVRVVTTSQDKPEGI